MRISMIDNFRAAAMMYVIMIHTIFWFGLFSGSGYRTLLLVEMPFFFMVSGMANYFAKSDDLARFYLSRFQRLLVPYWCFAALAGTAALVHMYITDAPPQSTSAVILHWLVPFFSFPSQLPYLTWALWFVPVYIVVTMLMPGLKKLYQFRGWKRYLPFIVFSLMVALFSYMPHMANKIIWEVVFYSLYVYIGFFFINYIYHMEKKEKWIICLCFSCCAYLVMGVLAFVGGMKMNMQANKFPPNLMFMVYNLSFAGIVSYFCHDINSGIERLIQYKFVRHIFDVYKNNCYTVFLYHPFAFLIVGGILKYFHLMEWMKGHSFLAVLLLYPILTILAAMIASIFAPIEKIRKLYV